MHPKQQPGSALTGAAKELTPEEKERLAQREAITKMAKSKPEEVAQLVVEVVINYYIYPKLKPTS